MLVARGPSMSWCDATEQLNRDHSTSEGAELTWRRVNVRSNARRVNAKARTDDTLQKHHASYTDYSSPFARSVRSVALPKGSRR
jgi:hypothetical protein